MSILKKSALLFGGLGLLLGLGGAIALQSYASERGSPGGNFYYSMMPYRINASSFEHGSCMGNDFD